MCVYIQEETLTCYDCGLKLTHFDMLPDRGSQSHASSSRYLDCKLFPKSIERIIAIYLYFFVSLFTVSSASILSYYTGYILNTVIFSLLFSVI